MVVLEFGKNRGLLRAQIRGPSIIRRNGNPSNKSAAILSMAQLRLSNTCLNSSRMTDGSEAYE